MVLSAEHITIAVTVFNRRTYLKQAIASALNQSLPVRVIVIEDCGPDSLMEAFVRQEFGARIQYFRNPRRRGIFGAWNACLDYCQTPWISILHDDDYLSAEFASAMLDLNRLAPDCGLYFGQTQLVNESGAPTPVGNRVPMTSPWRRVALADTFATTPFPFPGHLFRVDQARAVGGFRETSQFCGDWEMWSNLVARFGAAQTKAVVAYNRQHFSPGRGCTEIDRNGRLRPLVFVQQKRVLALLRRSGAPARFDRLELLRKEPMSATYLVKRGADLPARLLRYNVGLLIRSRPPSLQYAVFQALTRLFGVPFVKGASQMAGRRFRRSG
jgi:glycosyltransferase involved in cell wall biosynthesis